MAASGRKGPRNSSSSGGTAATLTAFDATRPSSAAATCSATITPARSCASRVDAPRCGVTTTFSIPSSSPGVGLVLEHVHRGTGDLARAKTLDERLLVDQLAAGDVDDPNAVLHARDLRPADHAAGLGREGRVQGNDVRASQQIVEASGGLDAELPHPLRRHERVEGDDVHGETAGPTCDLLADATEARPARASCPRARRRRTASAPSAPPPAPRRPAGSSGRARAAGRSCAPPPTRRSTAAR